MAKKIWNLCTECKEAEAIWHIRARTKFVCTECKSKIEWVRAGGPQEFKERE